MKNALRFVLAIIMLLPLVSCSPADSTDAEPTGLLADNGFVECAKSTFLEIGIQVDWEDFTIVRDDTYLGLRSVDANTTQAGMNMQLSCICRNDKWRSVCISDVDTERFYWVAEVGKDVYDVYDWRTGEKIEP